MTFKRITHTFSIAAVFFAAAMVLSLHSCSDDKGPKGPELGIRDSLPVLKSYGVSTLISDSGIIRYKIISEDWFIYDMKEPKYWSFKKGLFIEEFDQQYHVEAFISCDTAYFFYEQNLWELRGRVFVKNMKGTTFKTTLLYWNQQSHVVYSPAYMEIEGEDEALSGYDFRSNEQMTDYLIHSSKGKFPLNESNEQPHPDEKVMEEMSVVPTDE